METIANKKVMIGHSYINYGYIWFQLVNKFYGFLSVSSLPYNLQSFLPLHLKVYAVTCLSLSCGGTTKPIPLHCNFNTIAVLCLNSKGGKENAMSEMRSFQSR